MHQGRSWRIYSNYHMESFPVLRRFGEVEECYVSTHRESQDRGQNFQCSLSDIKTLTSEAQAERRGEACWDAASYKTHLLAGLVCLAVHSSRLVKVLA